MKKLKSPKTYKKLHIYLTGFGPYEEIKNNPTEKLVDNLFQNKSEYETSKTKIEFCETFEVTVDYINKNFKHIVNSVNQYNKNKNELHLIISYGLFVDGTEINIETQSTNFINDGNKIKQKIDKNVKEKYIKSLTDVENIVQIINKENKSNCSVSNDAGDYLCNYIYYKTIEFCKKNENVISIFIHIPVLEKINFEKTLSFFKESINAFEIYYLN